MKLNIDEWFRHWHDFFRPPEPRYREVAVKVTIEDKKRKTSRVGYYKVMVHHHHARVNKE